jgi:hypothetical protein
LFESVGFVPNINKFYKIIVQGSKQGAVIKTAMKNRVFREAEAAEDAFKNVGFGHGIDN